MWRVGVRVCLKQDQSGPNSPLRVRADAWEVFLSETTITVCSTCRRAAGGTPETEAPWPGERMAEALAAVDLPEGVRLREVACFSACSRGCVVALSGGSDHWTYVLGNLDPAADAAKIVAGAVAYGKSADGVVPWNEAPAILRTRTITRVPPQE